MYNLEHEISKLETILTIAIVKEGRLDSVLINQLERIIDNLKPFEGGYFTTYTKDKVIDFQLLENKEHLGIAQILDSFWSFKKDPENYSYSVFIHNYNFINDFYRWT